MNCDDFFEKDKGVVVCMFEMMLGARWDSGGDRFRKFNTAFDMQLVKTVSVLPMR